MIILAGILLLPLHGPAAHAAVSDLAISGRLSGVPAGQSLEISITPEVDQARMVKSIPIGSTAVQAGGRFAATVSIPTGVAPGRDGRSITIQIASRDQRWHALQVIYASREPSGKWRVDETRSLGTQFQARDVRSAAAAGGISSAANCVGGYAWALTPTAKYVYVPLQKGFTEKNTTVRYEWNTSSSTLFEALAGYRGGNFYSIGLSGSLQNIVEAGVKFDLKPKQRRVAMVEWQYRLSKEYCFLMNNLVAATGNEKWVPHSFAGGNKKKKIKKSFKCAATNKSTISSYTWVARSSSKTYGGYYSLVGIKIDARQTNSEAHRISYTPKNGKRATLCGSDAKIAYASMVKEMP